MVRTSIRIYGYEKCPYYKEAVKHAKSLLLSSAKSISCKKKKNNKSICKTEKTRLIFMPIKPGKEWSEKLLLLKQKYSPGVVNTHETSPIVIVNGKIIGGCDDFKKMKNEK
jgi:glutaredoxin